MVTCTGRGLVVKRPGILSKVQMLNLVLGVGVFSLLPMSVDRPVANSFVLFGCARIKRQAFCPILKGNMGIQRDSSGQEPLD